MSQATQDRYLLGHDDEELVRLEHQAALLAPATTALLKLAGIRPGMRVLDLGTGVGDVAFAAADIVGPAGSVVGVDRAPKAIATAQARGVGRGTTSVTFVEGDVEAYRDRDPFDAVVGRLVLLYVTDPARVIRHHAAAVRTGGVVLSMEYDLLTARSHPVCPTVTGAAWWTIEAFRRSGLNTTLGAELAGVFRQAGLSDVATLGMQPYLPSAAGASMLAGVVRTLLPVIHGTGIATPAEVDEPTLEQRLTRELDERGAVMIPPTLVGAWARVI